MTVYALIVPSSNVFLNSRDFGDRTPPDLAEAKDRKWVPYTETVASVDPAAEIATAPVVEVTGDGVAKTIGKRSLTAEELRARRDATDAASLRNAGKDLALVTVELIEKVLADNVIAATDFSPNVRTAFQNIKAIAGRLRA